MFDIDNKKEYTSWVDFPRDKEEKYLIRYIYEDDQEKFAKFTDQQNLDVLIENTLDWKGIVKDGKPFECNKRNKKILFTQLGPISIERADFLFFNMINPRNFYDLDDLIKNLKRG